jgi:glutamine amidotransferase
MIQDFKLVVVDYDSGNLRSVAKALEFVGVQSIVTSDRAEIASADAVVFPGVGSAPSAMAALNSRRLVQPLCDYVASGRPFLGVCLGLQLLMDHTEEGDAQCLGIVPGHAKRLATGLKVPHMGWNSVRFKQDHPILKGIPQDSHFYFVHSYYVVPNDANGQTGVTNYGVDFCSVYANGNLVATQFHPEKSGLVGLCIYKNFAAMAVQHADAGQRLTAES